MGNCNTSNLWILIKWLWIVVFISIYGCQSKHQTKIYATFRYNMLCIFKSYVSILTYVLCMCITFVHGLSFRCMYAEHCPVTELSVPVMIIKTVLSYVRTRKCDLKLGPMALRDKCRLPPRFHGGKSREFARERCAHVQFKSATPHANNRTGILKITVVWH